MRWGNWKMWKVNKSDLDIDVLTGGGSMLPLKDYAGDSPLGQTTVLYDLSVDVSERSNLASERPEVVERLELELEAWSSELAEPIWPSNRSTLYELHGQMVQLFF